MTKITGNWLSDPATQTVFSMLTDAGFKAYAVGGCVRNAVFGVSVIDVDIATDALPKKVMALAKAAGLNPIPTGIDHGTITVVSSGTPFEVTSFRKDIATDGRRAVVAFSDNINDDAKRRDFTMNALYCTADGLIIDPLSGMQDAVDRNLIFIDDPDQRIREDYLRILRFFRFYALYCDPANGIDANGLAACAQNLDGLSSLSKERIGAEMRRLLGAADPSPAMAAMAQSGVLRQVLPIANPQYLAPLIALEEANNIPPSWLRRLGVIGTKDARNALCLTRKEQKHLDQLAKAMANGGLSESSYRFSPTVALDATMIVAATLGSPMPTDFQQQIDLGATARFPISASDLMPDIPAGPKLGAELRRLENIWIKSGFLLDKSGLI
ncbi:MAG: CCA tRNA nucleotidyltransferase [Rhodobacteraceae bacterium]|nr:CCA tRNA nucleotidyltransferase [Paracoccaceae bacterium]